MAGIFRRLIGAFAPEAKMSSLELFKDVYGSRASKSGVPVGWQEAIGVPAVQACVRVLANGVAQVPFPLMQEDSSGNRVRVNDHPVARVLSRPNRWQTSFTLRETIMVHLVLTGNAFVWKGVVGKKRELRVLEPIEPGRVTVKRDTAGNVTYKVTADDGASQEFGAEDIWHIRGPSWAPWLGLDAVKLARDAIGLGLAIEGGQSDYYKGSAQVSGLLAVESAMSAEKYSFLSAWLDRHSVGGDRTGKPLVMDNGAKYTPFGQTGVDAQQIETRKHQIEEICRAFGVMPIMAGQSDKAATYASAEQMFLAHVVHSLSPWYARIEQSADAELLSDDDRAAGYYLKFNPNGLLRGAAKDQAEVFSAALGASGPGTAYRTVNEVRALMDLNPIEGGDKLPVGQQPAGASNGTN